MKAGNVKEFVSLRDSLLKERDQIKNRLSEIDQALGGIGAAGGAPVRRRGGRGMLQNPLSLKAAVIKATSKKALTKSEILDAIDKLGYRFATSNPINSLNVVLYGKKPKFKNAGGKFQPS